MRENSATKSLDLPNGADPERSDDGWETDTPSYRCVWSKTFCADPQISVGAVQLEDGTLSTAGNDAPTVFMDLSPISVEDCRSLAAALNAAADLAEKWGGTRGGVK